MRISDWSSDVCSSDLGLLPRQHPVEGMTDPFAVLAIFHQGSQGARCGLQVELGGAECVQGSGPVQGLGNPRHLEQVVAGAERSEERRVGKAWVSTCRFGGSTDT